MRSFSSSGPAQSSGGAPDSGRQAIWTADMPGGDLKMLEEMFLRQTDEGCCCKPERLT